MPNIPSFTDLNRSLRSNVRSRSSLKNTLKLGAPTSRDNSAVPPIPLYNTVLTGPNGPGATSAAITIVSGSQEQFRFNSILNPTGTPCSMALYVDNAPIMGVTFPSAYLTDTFQLITTSGIIYTGTFTNGSVYF